MTDNANSMFAIISIILIKCAACITWDIELQRCCTTAQYMKVGSNSSGCSRGSVHMIIAQCHTHYNNKISMCRSGLRQDATHVHFYARVYQEAECPHPSCPSILSGGMRSYVELAQLVIAIFYTVNQLMPVLVEYNFEVNQLVFKLV